MDFSEKDISNLLKGTGLIVRYPEVSEYFVPSIAGAEFKVVMREELSVTPLNDIASSWLERHQDNSDFNSMSLLDDFEGGAEILPLRETEAKEM